MATSPYISTQHVTLHYIWQHYHTFQLNTSHFTTDGNITIHFNSTRHTSLQMATLPYSSTQHVTLHYRWQHHHTVQLYSCSSPIICNHFPVEFVVNLKGTAMDRYIERKEMFYLTTHSTHFITVIWRRSCSEGPFRH